MCRLLSIRSERPFEVREQLQRFAAMCHVSAEYQGHGWGVALLRDSGWELRRWIDPIWQHDDFDLGSTRCLVAHARSAFRDEGIVVENNMPFRQDGLVFAFNGELRGVRLALPGRTGAEKIFELIRRLDRGDRAEAFEQAFQILHRRSQYVRALNVILSDGDQLHIGSSFAERPDYFTLYRHDGELDIVCSQPLGPAFVPLPNGCFLHQRSRSHSC